MAQGTCWAESQAPGQQGRRQARDGQEDPAGPPEGGGPPGRAVRGACGVHLFHQASESGDGYSEEHEQAGQDQQDAQQRGMNLRYLS